jgi:hypothetical protein
MHGYLSELSTASCQQDQVVAFCSETDGTQDQEEVIATDPLVVEQG